MAVPGSIFSPQSQGTHYLLQQGAFPVTSVEDVLNVLGITYEKNNENLELNEEEHLLAAIFRKGDRAWHFDELLEKTGWPFSRLSEVLLGLELKGLLQGLPGKYYQWLG